MIRDSIEMLVQGRSLSRQEAAQSMAEIMDGEATPAQFGAFVTALRLKGETSEEITGMAQIMREKSLHVSVDGPMIDTCGTGGDGSNSFNVSTAAAVVVASANIYVAKHGNRAASGTCGSADLPEAVGVKIDLAPEGVKKCIETVGIGFMFAPVFHPAMKHVAKPRKEMGIRTVFNILGPRTNPAGAKKQMIGIADKSQGELLARVLVLLGSEHAMIVHGEDGLDEITISGKTNVWEIKNKEIQAYEVAPQELGVKTNSLDEIKGESISDNVTMFRSVMDGKQGPCMDIVTLNAGAALYVAGATGSIKDGQAIAENCIKNGTARAKMSQLAEISQRIGIEDKEQDY